MPSCIHTSLLVKSLRLGKFALWWQIERHGGPLAKALIRLIHMHLTHTAETGYFYFTAPHCLLQPHVQTHIV